MIEPREPMTILQQADLLDYLIKNIRADKPGNYVVSTLDETEMQDLRATADRLRRMAPHEDAIKRLVTRK